MSNEPLSERCSSSRRGTGHIPVLPTACSAWRAGGGDACKEQQSVRITHTHTHTFVHISLVWIELLSDNEVFTERSGVVALQDRCLLNDTSVSELHLNCYPTVRLWSLKTRNVQSPELPEKSGLSTHTEAKQKRPFLTYINPAHKITFSFASLQKDFREINLKERIQVIYGSQDNHRFHPRNIAWLFSLLIFF